MNEITFTDNSGNRLLQDHFADIRTRKLREGQQLTAYYKSIKLGLVEVTYLQPIFLSSINDAIAGLTYGGRSSQWVTRMLTNLLGGSPKPTTQLHITGFKWIKRNMLTQEEMLQTWADDIKRIHGHTVTQQALNY